MSRRNRHPRHQHPAQGPRPRPTSPAGDRSGASAEAASDRRADVRPQGRAELRSEVATPRVAYADAPPQQVAQPEAVVPDEPRPAATHPVAAAEAAAPTPAGPPVGPGRDAQVRGDADLARPTCTVAQLRRFIKSRPWIPLHELRRRFGIHGDDDDVSPIRVGDHVLFIGLPPPESSLMAELLAGGDVGYELGLDPRAPIVVGVYPMRPVPRG